MVSPVYPTNTVKQQTMSDDKTALKPTSTSSSTPRPLLPLDWTRVNKRKRRSKGVDNQEGGGEISLFCCEDPSCRRQQDCEADNNTINNTINAGETESNSKSLPLVPIATKNSRVDQNHKKTNEKSKMTSLNGKGVFCLHSFDSKWFQGHFISSSNSVPSSFGLLAVERNDVDKCLQCKDGGYKEIDLTILSSSRNADKDVGAGAGLNGDAKKSDISKRRKLNVNQLICTGGDMLRITTTSSETQDDSNIQVSFDADKVITGSKVESLVKRYFPTLVNKANCDDDESILDVLPDCAVVIGDMNIRVPTNFIYGSDRNDVVDDDWLE